MRFQWLWLLFALGLAAAEPAPQEWELDAKSSTLTFVFTQADTVQTGEFKSYTARFWFDPDDLVAGHFEVVIDLAKLDTGDPERDKILRSDGLFAVDRWSQASFRAFDIHQQGDNQYLAEAVLVIRDQTHHLQFPFMLEFSEGGSAFRLQAAVSLNRLDYEVGQGDWASTTWVGNEVNVLVDIVAKKTE